VDDYLHLRPIFDSPADLPPFRRISVSEGVQVEGYVISLRAAPREPSRRRPVGGSNITRSPRIAVRLGGIWL